MPSNWSARRESEHAGLANGIDFGYQLFRTVDCGNFVLWFVPIVISYCGVTKRCGERSRLVTSAAGQPWVPSPPRRWD